MFGRAESAREDGSLELAARLFGRAAGTWRSAGDVLDAADAYLELGAVLLRQGRGHLLPDLSVRVEDLLKVDPLPAGARLSLRIFIKLIARGSTHPEAFLGLVQERRLARHRLSAVSVDQEICTG